MRVGILPQNQFEASLVNADFFRIRKEIGEFKNKIIENIGNKTISTVKNISHKEISNNNFRGRSSSLAFVVGGIQYKADLLFTKDKNLLEQYYRLREDSYQHDLGFDHYNGSESKYDKEGDILLVLYKGEVVGGARINFSDRTRISCNEQQSSESIYIRLLKRFDPNFCSSSDLYAEICAITIRKDLRIGSFYNSFFKHIVKSIKASGYKYLVAISYPLLCRKSEMILKSNGIYAKTMKDEPCIDSIKSKYGNTEKISSAFPILARLDDAVKNMT